VSADRAGSAWFDGLHATGLVESTDDLGALERGGWWAVMITFAGEVRLWRFADVRRAALPIPAAEWRGPRPGAWRSSLGRAAYLAGVEEIRRRIREGDVYQVNLCRILEADLPDRPEPMGDDGSPLPGGGDPGAASPWALAARLARGNPAPYAGVIDVPATRLVCASPELFLARDGDRVVSGPIKGTGRTRADLLPKDDAENVMIVDLVRNDLQRVSEPGSVVVPSLLRVEEHPGLVHLVSTVEGRLQRGRTWRELLAATSPPGSVSGAPKHTALQAIADLERAPRGPYCGAIGYVDADRGRARLAVGIRTFWWAGGTLRFGTGAGITWGSEPAREWAETELKAARLIGLAGERSAGPGGAQVRSRATAASRSR
jgi:para-aminobenzoate synthetase component 1